ncbi:MAG: nuclear transport factor 2 family protein [Marinobacter sp.]
MNTPNASTLTTGQPVPGVVGRFQQLFNTLAAGDIAGLDQVYSAGIRFTDPFTSVEGLDELHTYLEKVYANVRHCHFDFLDVIVNGDQACLVWVMHLQHPRLRGGRRVIVHGLSHLIVSGDRIRFHRDYFDAAELLYGNLPLLGPAIRWIRNYAS